MRKIYDDTKEESLNTETKIAVDEAIEQKFGNLHLLIMRGLQQVVG